MERRIPLWVLLLCLLLAALFMVAFGWAVRSTTAGSDRSGLFGEAAVAVASFPTLVKDSISQLAAYGSGDYVDREFAVPRPALDLAGFTAVSTPAEVAIPGLLLRRSGTPARGWRILIGTYRINDTIQHAALLLSPALSVAKALILEDAAVGDEEPNTTPRIFPHGATLLDDGSLAFTFDGGSSLQSVDLCGGRRWTTAGPHGGFHHAVSRDDDGTLWTFTGSTNIAQVSAETGEILRSFSMQEVIDANPAIDILELRRLHPDNPRGNDRNTTGKWLEEELHLNDVDPLPDALAAAFEGFAPGDLVISARSVNLVFVLDPDSLKVKWWRVGATQRQHDPDWQPNGELTVFNNRMSRDYSEIVAIDPQTFRSRVLFDGRRNDFYTRVRGKHQIMPTGHLVVTSSQQGRAFEVAPDGEVVLEFVNTKPATADTNYVLSELIWVPSALIDTGISQCEN